ncbi:MAG: lectin [Proteobacteria bacterium]|nr:lectin [Pseudomonadota bacterium]
MSMIKAAAAALVLALTACAPAPAPEPQKPSLGFFITSTGVGDGAALGGLAGADRHCQALAQAVGAGGRTWRAYLSTGGAAGRPAVNARDRIGAGPWTNAAGVVVAQGVADLHGPGAQLSKAASLNERGEVVNGRGDTPNRHDILTGSQADGAAFAGPEDKTCRNWTSNAEGSAQVGHHDRQGGGPDPTSWNSAHGSRGCSQANLQSSGGDGLFYCFAAD